MTESEISNLLHIIITFLASIAASSGFWLFVEKRTVSTDAYRKVILGLAHDRIIYLCLKYIDRGYITQDEYENLSEFLYKPYKAIGGNGTAERLMKEIDKLPISKDFIRKGDLNVT